MDLPKNVVAILLDDGAWEKRAIKELAGWARRHAPMIQHRLWNWGDGQGGWLLRKIATEAAVCSSIPRREGKTKTKKFKISPSKRLRIYARDSYACRKCGTHDDLTIDHILARSRGGTNHDDNLQTLCGGCNTRKGDRL